MAKTLIATATASSSSSLSFTSGIDSTYDVYEFHFVNIHPATDNTHFGFQVNAVGGSGFNETITSTLVEAYHNEAGSANALVYDAGDDQAQGTAYNIIAGQNGTDSDQACSGILTLYNPSSTTYVKHFTSNANVAHFVEYSTHNLVAGYINTTAAIDEISFKFSSGNIDAGSIKMFGVS